MTARWIEGFEASRHDTIFGRYWGAASGTIGVSHPGPRVGNALKSASNVLRTPELVAVDENTWIIGLHFMVANGTSGAFGFTNPQNAIPYVAVRNGTGEQIRFEFIYASSGSTKPGGAHYKVRVVRGATTLATSNEMWLASEDAKAWVYFEWKVTIDTVTGSFSARWHDRWNKTQTMTWDSATTGLDTANQGVAGGDSVEFSLNTGTDNDPVAMDNIYIFDGSGASNNDFYGELHIEGLKPSGNGDTLDWSLAGGAASIEDAWNEGATVQSTAEDDKRATSQTPTEISLATLGDLVYIKTSPILGVMARFFGKMESTGSRDVQAFYRKTTGTPAQTGGAIHTFSSTAIEGFSDFRATDPNTGSAWVIADINGLQLGVELDA